MRDTETGKRLWLQVGACVRMKLLCAWIVFVHSQPGVADPDDAAAITEYASYPI